MTRIFGTTGLSVAIAVLGLPTMAQARPSQWWYVAQGADRVLFVDEKSIDRDGDVVRYAASQVLRDPGSDVAQQRAFMRTDCGKRTQTWEMVMRYGADDMPLDPATASFDDVQRIEEGTIGEAELNFVCAADRSTTDGFPLEIDEIAFAEALIADKEATVRPADVHARMKADPSTPMIRSSAPSPSSFGSEQRVATGRPIVPPRDYAKGIEPPAALDYDADEVGRIYDVAYQGVEKGELVFEIRGYAISDLAHPGSGQMLRFPLTAKTAQVNDLAVTIIEATPKALRYKVERKKADAFGFPGAGG
ncbi:MAG: hypothetical protein V4618_08540 [Pseudomonadota bacterium]